MRRRCRATLPPQGLVLERIKTKRILENLLLVAPIAALLLVAWPFSVCTIDSCLDSCLDCSRSRSFPPTIVSIPVATAFSSFAVSGKPISDSDPDPNTVFRRAYKPVVVVGKIIIDEYGDPYPYPHSKNKQNEKQQQPQGTSEQPPAPPAPPKSVSIGGGGPQAAFGAASALAVWDTYYNNNNIENGVNDQPPPPPIVFVAPVGKDWGQSETKALESSLGASASVIVHNDTAEADSPACSGAQDQDGPPMIRTHLIVKNTNTNSDGDDGQESDNGFFTPRIRLWHDANQTVHWYALNDSFGPKGADGLWRNNPSARDLISILERGDREKNNTAKNNNSNNIVLHAIAETWTGAAGGQLDFLPLLLQDEAAFRNNLAFVGIEPVASGEVVTKEDAQVAASVLRKCCDTLATQTPSCDTLFWCPDRDLYEAMDQNGLYNDYCDENQSAKSAAPNTKTNCRGLVQLEAIRDGPRGSTTRTITSNSKLEEEKKKQHVPAATLAKDDGSPTGAGNAYAGAMTALLGNNVPLSTAACIATGVGAVVCEHEGLPPQGDWQSTLERIASAAREVDSKMPK